MAGDSDKKTAEQAGPEGAVRFVYVTTETVGEANEIAEAIVGTRLAACANLIPGMTSLYRWNGEVVSAEETVLIFKTRADLIDRLVEQVKVLHSYDVPCIVALPVVGGNQAFLDWVVDETANEMAHYRQQGGAPRE